MAYSDQSTVFRAVKHQFFTEIAPLDDVTTKLEIAEQRAKAMGYSFLQENKAALETEFSAMFSILRKKSKEDSKKAEVFWVYCYYCASLLEAYSIAYSQQGKADDFIQMKNKIKDRLANKAANDDLDETFIEYMFDSFNTSLNNLSTAPFHLSRIRDYVAYANLCRIYWVFSRLTMTAGFTLARDLNLIDKLDALLGTHTDVDKIISVFQAPTAVINYFSVGFFLARFIIDGGLLLRHTFFPSALERGTACTVHKLDTLPGVSTIDAYRNSYIIIQNKETSQPTLYYIPKVGDKQQISIKQDNDLNSLEELMNKKKFYQLKADEIKALITIPTGHIPETSTVLERFKHELYKRHCNFANDLVWATVNFLTNFNHITQIPGPVAVYITAAFLVFDVCMVLYKCHLAKQEYLVKKGQYEQEIQDYRDLIKSGKMKPSEGQMHIDMLEEQLKDLEISWKAKEATFYFVAAAAALLMMGFTASTLVSPAALAVACFFVCTLAVAMYLSSGAYSQYIEKSLYLEQAELTGKNLAVAQKEYEAARNDFIFTMIKNTVVPMVLIATFAVCWQAAIVLTAMYIGFEAIHAYCQHCDRQQAKKLALEAPTDDNSLCFN